MSRLATLLTGLLLAANLHAHPGSTAYLQAETRDATLTLRADYALADLDDAIGLDTNDDGAITWGEVRAAAPAVQSVLAGALRVQGDAADCPLTADAGVQIADHGGQPYAIYTFRADCPSPPGQWTLHNTALFGFDAQHRALLRWREGAVEQSTVMAPERQGYTFDSTAAPAAASQHTLATYWQEGLDHVWSGWDHLLFITGLFLAAALVRVQGRWQPAPRLGTALLDAAKLVTAFTLAHAITLCLTVLGWVNLPSRFVESLVALSVLFAGLNNLRPVVDRRGLFALAWVFGLIHGTAIAGALLDLGLPASGRLVALLGFNLGVEAAQLLLVLVLVPLAFALRQWRGYVPFVLWPGSLAVALAGAVWFVDRAFGMDWPLPI